MPSWPSLKPLPVNPLAVANLATVETKITEPKALASKSTFLVEVVSDLLFPNKPVPKPKSVLKTSSSQTKKPSLIKLRFPRLKLDPASKIKDAASQRDLSPSKEISKLLKRVKTPPRVSHLLNNAVRKPVKPRSPSPSRATPALRLLFQAPKAQSTTINHADANKTMVAKHADS